MIFVTVGGQLPFDRLVHAVDRWAMDQKRKDVFAQIGNSNRPPNHIQWKRFLSPADFQSRAGEAELIIAHAGMGSILTALEFGKRIVVMPRRRHLGEIRSDHQWATINRLGGAIGVASAADENELVELLGRMEELRRPTDGCSQEYMRLLDFLRHAIEGRP